MTDTPNIASLQGSEWGAPDLGDAFVGFQTGGKVTGYGGCNRFFGNFLQAGTQIKIGPLASTKKMCPPAQMNTERRLMDALEMAEIADATHLVLILKSKDGTPLLELQRRDWD